MNSALLSSLLSRRHAITITTETAKLFTGHEADIAANESEPYIPTPTDEFIAAESALPENPEFRKLFWGI